MPEQRRIYAQRITEAGLTPPDERSMHLLWQIVDEGVLGASNHVRLTQDLILHLIQNAGSGTEAWLRAHNAAAFIAETRGRQAPVVANAVRLLMQDLEAQPNAQRLAMLTQRIDQWQADAARRMKRLVAGAVATIGPGRTVVAYDYSSTVAEIVLALAKEATPASVVVPESRAISGGRRYLEAFAGSGLVVRYVVDAAFEHVLDDNAVVLLGAESVRCDGSLTNTIGSRPLARLAQWRGCPVYGCTELIKLDLRSYKGHFARPVERRFDNLVDGLELADGLEVDTRTPELEVVPADLVSAFLTEVGPVPPAAIWQLGRETFRPPSPEADL